MKSKIILAGLLTATMTAMGLSGCASEDKAQAQLQAQARVGRQQAEHAALDKTPGGAIKDSALENDGGKLIWWFDIATPGAKDITEVSVDATTGGVISVATEMPEN